MRMPEPCEYALEDAGDLGQREAGNDAPERSTLEVLHRDERGPSCSKYSWTVTMFGWLSEPGNARLAQEALHEGGVGCV